MTRQPDQQGRPVRAADEAARRRDPGNEGIGDGDQADDTAERTFREDPSDEDPTTAARPDEADAPAMRWRSAPPQEWLDALAAAGADTVEASAIPEGRSWKPSGAERPEFPGPPPRGDDRAASEAGRGQRHPPRSRWSVVPVATVRGSGGRADLSHRVSGAPPVGEDGDAGGPPRPMGPLRPAGEADRERARARRARTTKRAKRRIHVDPSSRDSSRPLDRPPAPRGVVPKRADPGSGAITPRRADARHRDPPDGGRPSTAEGDRRRSRSHSPGIGARVDEARARWRDPSSLTTEHGRGHEERLAEPDLSAPVVERAAGGRRTSERAPSWPTLFDEVEVDRAHAQGAGRWPELPPADAGARGSAQAMGRHDDAGWAAREERLISERRRL